MINVYELHTMSGLNFYIVAEDWTKAYDIMQRNHPDEDVVSARNVSLGSEVMIGV